MRIDLVGTTADFRRFGPPRPLQVNHLPCENCAMLGRIGEVGLILVRSLIGHLVLRQCEAREGVRDHARENLKGFGAGFGVELHARRCRRRGQLEKRQSQLHGSSPLWSRGWAAGSGRG